MFNVLRWRLTVWYLAAFAVVFLVLAVAVFFLVHHRLSAQVDSTVREVSDTARAAVALPTASDQVDTVRLRNERLKEVLLTGSLGRSADVFILLLDNNGMVVGNPRDAPLEELPDADAVEHAHQTGEDWRTVTKHDREVRIRTVPLLGLDGQLDGYIQAGKSLEERDESLETLAVVMAFGGLAGLGLATVGGLAVAGIAMRPIRASFARQQEFVADASHELRTPLAVIRANAEAVMARGSHDGALEDIAYEAAYMTRLLDDLLLLASSDHQTLRVVKARIDLCEVARSAADAGSKLAALAGLRFVTDIHGPVIVHADPERCRELLLILIDNAIKYTPRGGLITLRTNADENKGTISVSDTGEGISPEELRHVFDRFYRADKARSRSDRAVGLGLSIAKEVVNAHEGSIDLQSEPGKGTTAIVRMPLAGGSA